jgi:hypothetical protein
MQGNPEKHIPALLYLLHYSKEANCIDKDYSSKLIYMKPIAKYSSVVLCCQCATRFDSFLQRKSQKMSPVLQPISADHVLAMNQRGEKSGTINWREETTCDVLCDGRHNTCEPDALAWLTGHQGASWSAMMFSVFCGKERENGEKKEVDFLSFNLMNHW